MNTKTLLIQANAFGFYLFSVIGINAVTIIYLAHPTPTTELDWGIGSEVFYVASFISQVCLCFILWDLGTKDESEDASEEEEAKNVEAEDEQIDARIWDSFKCKQANEMI